MFSCVPIAVRHSTCGEMAECGEAIIGQLATNAAKRATERTRAMGSRITFAEARQIALRVCQEAQAERVRDLAEEARRFDETYSEESETDA